MDFQCDLYVYEDVGGYLYIGVAGNRPAIDISKLPPKPNWRDITNPENMKRYLDRQKMLREMLDKCDRHPIGLPSDGKSYHAATWKEAVEILERLRAEGYVFPDYVLEEAIESRDSGLTLESDEQT